VGEFAHGHERWVIQREIRVGARGRAKAAIATAPPPHKDLCDTQKPAKIGAVSATTWHFGPEDLVKTKFIIICCKMSMDSLFKSFEKF
jgi:hypothetical protein